MSDATETNIIGFVTLIVMTPLLGVMGIFWLFGTGRALMGEITGSGGNSDD